PETLNGRQIAQFEGSVAGVCYQMNEAAVAELDHHVTEVLRRLRLQRFEHRLDQAAILRHRFRLHPVAHELVFHLTFSATGAWRPAWSLAWLPRGFRAPSDYREPSNHRGKPSRADIR